MKTKSILTLLVIVAAFITLNNTNVFAQEVPVFNVTVKGEMCSGLISGAEVEIYRDGDLIASGKTGSDGIVRLGNQMPGDCPYSVTIYVYYPSKDNLSQISQKTVIRSCSGNYEELCLGAPQR